MQLISWLAFAGARDSSGAVVASGKLWAYQIGGGTTSAVLYGDEDGTQILTQPVTLDAAGRATVYTASPTRFVVQTSAGASVTDKDEANVIRAECVQIDSDAYSSTFLSGALDALATSVGGDDAMFLLVTGATPRTIQSKFAELCVSVKDFGAAGDGLQVDSTAIQAAVNYVGFLEGGEVYFPPGTYKIDVPITNSVNGVSLQGAGSVSTVIVNTGATTNAFTWTGVDGFYVRDLQINCAASSSTGTAFAAATDGSVATFSGLRIEDHDVAVSLAALQTVSVANCHIVVNDGTASARGIVATGTLGLSVVGTYIYGGNNASGYAVALEGATATTSFTGCFFDSRGFRLNTTGTSHKFVGNRTNASVPIVVSTAAFPAGFYQAGNGIDGYTVTVAAGGAVTPDLTQGYEITIHANAGGAGNVTINAPAILPSTSDRGVRLTLKLVNNTGGAVTWVPNAVFVHVGGTAPVGTDGTTSLMQYAWDIQTSELREVSRANTTT